MTVHYGSLLREADYMHAIVIPAGSRMLRRFAQRRSWILSLQASAIMEMVAAIEQSDSQSNARVKCEARDCGSCSLQPP